MQVTILKLNRVASIGIFALLLVLLLDLSGLSACGRAGHTAQVDAGAPSQHTAVDCDEGCRALRRMGVLPECDEGVRALARMGIPASCRIDTSTPTMTEMQVSR
jgi:hypothetical protein